MSMKSSCALAPLQDDEPPLSSGGQGTMLNVSSPLMTLACRSLPAWSASVSALGTQDCWGAGVVQGLPGSVFKHD